MGSKSTDASRVMAKALAPKNTPEGNQQAANTAGAPDNGSGALPSFMYASVDPSLLARCSKVQEKDAAAKADALANSFGALLATTIDAAGLTLAALFRLSDTGGGKGGGDGLLDYGEVKKLSLLTSRCAECELCAYLHLHMTFNMLLRYIFLLFLVLLIVHDRRSRSSCEALSTSANQCSQSRT
jgi:hypothetical protein